MQKEYQIAGKNGSRELAKLLAANGQVVLSEAREAVGVSKLSKSREFVLASEEECKRLLERRFERDPGAASLRRWA